MSAKENSAESLEKKTNKEARSILRKAMAAVDFTKNVVPVVDEEDGCTYYVVEKGSGLRKRHVDTIDDALILVAKLFRDAGIPNRSRFYSKIGRMVHYALYEFESRAMLTNEIYSVQGVDSAEE
jgi:hypothetical protein